MNVSRAALPGLIVLASLLAATVLLDGLASATGPIAGSTCPGQGERDAAGPTFSLIELKLLLRLLDDLAGPASVLRPGDGPSNVLTAYPQEEHHADLRTLAAQTLAPGELLHAGVPVHLAGGAAARADGT